MAGRKRGATVPPMRIYAAFLGCCLIGGSTFLAIRLGDSFVTTGLVIGLFEFVLFWVLTAYYVVRANSEFDALTEAVLRESMKAKK